MILKSKLFEIVLSGIISCNIFAIGEPTNTYTVNPSTISTTLKYAKPGAILYLQSGNYSTIIDGVHGTSKKPIVLAPADSSTCIDGGNSTDTAFHFKNSSYIKLQNLNIKHYIGAGAWLDNGSNNITLSNLDISDMDPINVNCTGGTEGILGSNATYIVVDHCKIHHIGMKNYELRQRDQGIYMSDNSNYWTITNNIINNIDDCGIQIKCGQTSNGGSSDIIQYNYICGAMTHGGILIDDNSVSDSIYDNYFYNNHDFDLGLWNQHHNSNYGHVIKRNFFLSRNFAAHLQFWDMNIAPNYFSGNTYYSPNYNTPVSNEAGTCDYTEGYLNFSDWKSKGQDIGGTSISDRTSILNKINQVIQNCQ